MGAGIWHHTCTHVTCGPKTVGLPVQSPGLPRPIPVGMYPQVLLKKTYFARQQTILAPFVIL